MYVIKSIVSGANPARATTVLSSDREMVRAAARRFSRRLLTRDDADAWHALARASP